jgi:uncharacterized protein
VNTPTVCIYHGDCNDGFGAAWAVWKRFGDTVKFVPGVYGKAPPAVDGEHVLLVDFSYKADVMRHLAAQALSVTVLDHHKTAQAELEPLFAEGVIGGEFDMSRSGAVMAWQWFHPGKDVPLLLLFVQDRDLWQFKLADTREIHAAISSHPHQFKIWSLLADRCDFSLSAQDLIAEGAAIPRKFSLSAQDLIAEGAAILRKHTRDVVGLVKATQRTMVIGGFEVPVANLPFTMASDAGEMMAHGVPFAATYYDRADGARVFSLRSRGEGSADVSEIARRYGGGGHSAAAGFQAPKGWEGDVP